VVVMEPMKLAAAKGLGVLAFITPIALLIDEAWTVANIWHDLFMIATTVIGVLIVQLLRGYRKAQTDLVDKLVELQKTRTEDRAAIKLEYATELGMLHKQLNVMRNLLISYSFKLFQDDDDRTEFIRTLNSGGD
jgi:uncharacterized membrane-anchored protein YhcB (DUF1043 family)